jgi:hypothetical protein
MPPPTVLEPSSNSDKIFLLDRLWFRLWKLLYDHESVWRRGYYWRFWIWR